MKTKLIILLILCSALSACKTLQDPYERPALPVSDSWSTVSAASDAPATAASEVPWQSYYKDERLRSVIELALKNNRDLRVALLNVERTQALYRIQSSELWPSVGAMASGEVTRVPDKASTTGTEYTYKQFSVNLGIASWEIDLFGRLRSLKESALEQYFATEQTACAAEDSLVSAVAAAYLTLAADSETLALARSSFETQQSSYDLIRRSRELGVASELDLSQALSQVEQARAVIATYTGRIASDRNSLELLVGAGISPDLLPDRLSAVAETPDVSAGLPSDVLLRRPDILAAEHSLKAANANIGAARAAFFPNISLTTAVGTASSDLMDLFQSGTGTWTFQPTIAVPLFAGGGLKANLDAAKVEREITVAQYEKAIQAAFADVNDALTLRATLVTRRTAEEALVTALSNAYRLSDARYKAGVDSYLAVLVAQRSLFSAQQSLISARLAEQLNRVTLYKVLGGGI